MMLFLKKKKKSITDKIQNIEKKKLHSQYLIDCVDNITLTIDPPYMKNFTLQRYTLQTLTWLSLCKDKKANIRALIFIRTLFSSYMYITSFKDFKDFSRS